MAPTIHKTPTTNPNKHCPTQSPSSPPKTRDQTENHIKRPSRASSSSHRYTSKRPTPVRLNHHPPNQPPYFTIQPQKRRQRTPSIPDHVVKEHRPDPHPSQGAHRFSDSPASAEVENHSRAAPYDQGATRQARRRFRRPSTPGQPLFDRPHSESHVTAAAPRYSSAGSVSASCAAVGANG